jgi:hypothetical protein
MSEITQITKRMEQLHADLDRQIKETREKVAAEAQTLVKFVFEAFFVKHPTVHAIGWTQYTPYWQDGEECTFRVNEINLYINEDSFDEDEGWHDGDQNLLDRRDYHLRETQWHKPEPDRAEIIDKQIEDLGGMGSYRAILADFEAVASSLAKIDDRYMEMIYGDHVSVFYTKDGVVIEEYEHH